MDQVGREIPPDAFEGMQPRRRYDHTDFGGSTYSYSQKLTSAVGQQVGVAKSYMVYPGDKIRIEAYAKYMSSTGSGDLAGFATSLLAAFGYTTPPAGGETGTPKAGLNTWGGIVAGGGGNGSGSYPKAFVNLLVFDKNYKFLDTGWDQINGGEQIGAETKAAHDYMMQEYTAREEGYIYVYVSNENSTLVEVYFDDVTVTHTKSNLIQYNEYYPFGMQTANSWTRENTLDYNFLANGGTELNKTSNLYDLDYRNYDPVLGRMNGVDPMATKYASLTPYNFSFNDPVTFTDVSGADPWDYGPYAGSELYYYSTQGPDGMGPGQMAIMDPHGYGMGGGGVNWNPVTAGGYGQQVGRYINSMSLNYENLSNIRYARAIEGQISLLMSSPFGGSWSPSNGLSIYGSPSEAHKANSGSGVRRNSDPGTRIVQVPVTRGTNHWKWGRTQDGRRTRVIDHRRGVRRITLTQPISVPTFAGGFLTDDIEDGLNKMWRGSYKANGRYMMENLAYMTDHGLLILPNTHNTAHSSRHHYVESYSNGVLSIRYNGVLMRVLHYVHTHPDMVGIQKPTPGSDYTYTSELGIHDFIIGHFSVLEAFKNILGKEEYQERYSGSSENNLRNLAGRLSRN